MKKFKFNKISIIVLAVMFTLGVFGIVKALSPATPPTLVGSANYSVLGHETVTNTGATTTTGEVGVSSGTAITGFDVPGGPGFAAGSNAIHVHSNDASAIAAQADNLTAFGALDSDANAVANCTNPIDLSPGSAPDTANLGGLTLAPGLYCSAGSFRMMSDLTLTGAGPWVFKTVSSLIISNGSSVLVPDDNACDVWWRVGTSATIGTDAAFKGNILALTSVSLATGANLVGRAFAQTGSVTLDTNTITGCAAPLVSAHLTLDKKVVGGSSVESAWTLTAAGPMTLSGQGAAGSTDVVGNVSVGTYNLSESTGPSRFNASTWSCTLNGGDAVVGDSIVLAANDTAVCTITNTYHAPSSGGSSIIYGCKDPAATNYNAFSASNPALCVYEPTPTPTITILSTPVVVAPIIPKLPKTGFPPQESSTWYESLLNSFLNLFR